MLEVSSKLTKREEEVLALIKIGKTDKEISQELCISVNTARKHVENILSKYGVHDRKKLICNVDK